MDIQRDNDPRIALNAYGTSDVWLHGNPNITIYEKDRDRTYVSQFTYNVSTFDDIDVDNNTSIASIDLSTQEKKNMIDLLGTCYFDCIYYDHTNSFEPPESIRLFDSIEFHIEYEINSEIRDITLETLYYDTIFYDIRNILFMESVTIEESCTGKTYHYMMNLPFFFTKRTESYIPLFECMKAKRVYFKLNNPNPNLIVSTSPYIVYKSVVMDEKFKMYNKVFNTNDKIVCLSKTKVFKNICSSMTTNEIVVPLAHQGFFAVKDLQISLKRSDINQSNYKEDMTKYIKNVTLYLNDRAHMSLNNLMGYRLIPQTIYKNNVKQGIFCMNFCEDPLEEKYSHTNDINFHRLDKANLVIELHPYITCKNSNGEDTRINTNDVYFDITIFRREYNLMQIAYYYCKLVYDLH